MNFEYKINGRRFSERNFKNSIEGAILGEIQSSVKKRIGFMRCHDHHSSPSVKVEGRNLDNMQLLVNACCEKFEAEVAKKLN